MPSGKMTTLLSPVRKLKLKKASLHPAAQTETKRGRNSQSSSFVNMPVQCRNLPRTSVKQRAAHAIQYLRKSTLEKDKENQFDERKSSCRSILVSPSRSQPLSRLENPRQSANDRLSKLQNNVSPFRFDGAIRQLQNAQMRKFSRTPQLKKNPKVRNLAS